MIEEKIDIKVNNKKITVLKGITLSELIKLLDYKSENPIILGKVNGTYKELSFEINRECEVEFVDILDIEGNRAYVNGLIYLTIFAGKNVLPKHKFIVQHSIDKGIYIKTDKKISKDDILLLKKQMKEIIRLNLNIEKLNVNRIDAIEYFKSIGDDSKVNLLKYNTNTFITLYKLSNMYNFFFSLMPVEVRCLEKFDLKYLNENGFVLLYQTRYMKDGIKSFENHSKVFESYEHYYSWITVMDTRTVSQLNKKVSSGNIADFIRVNETLQSGVLLQIAKQIYDNKNRIRVILMAGPSSSGKTTTCSKLSMYLRGFGMHPKTLSMDNYFIERSKMPKDEFGKTDFESIKALDLDLLNKHVEKMIALEEVKPPIFDFINGKPIYNAGDVIKLESEDILIIEGIHALNPELLSQIPNNKIFKIFLSPLSCINFDDSNRISSSDNRLLRRIIRDNTYRGDTVERTLELWDSVRRGEEKNIFPYQDEADVVYNTSLVYEMGVLKTYVEPLLYSVDINSPYYNEAKRLINMLKMFLPISSEDIPKESVLREFIGGGCFLQ